jgi:hypothetical protein
MFELSAGIVIVALVLSDVFRSVVVPGATQRALRLGPMLGAVALPLWRSLARLARSPHRRHGLLNSLGPLIVVVQLLLWAVGLTFGFGLVLHALGAALDPSPDFGEALFQAGSSVLTLGLTNVRAEGVAQVVVLFAGLSGLAVITLVVTFSLSVQGALQRRESQVVLLAARGGRPPSGLVVLETQARLGLWEDDLKALLARWEEWCAEVIHTHQAFPILAFFRSTDGDNDWLSSLGAVLDAAALAAVAAGEGPRGEAALLLVTGGRLVDDLCRIFRLRPVAGPLAREEEEFAGVLRRLAAAGWPVRGDEEGSARRRFAELRSGYAPGVTALAAHFGVPGPVLTPPGPPRSCNVRRPG